MALDARAWRSCRLGDVVELKRGYDLPQQQRKPGSVPVISSSGPSGFHSEAMAKAPGVVTGRYGTLGQVFFVTSDFWPLNTTLYVRDFKGNDPKFISYFLKTIDFFSCSDKAAVPGVNRNHLHELPVRVPPLDDQRAIAHILGTLDDKIELNRRMNETLEAMARALFKSWFVDFDPVRAKAEGRTPSGMDAETAKLFPSEFVDSELGPIPKGWSVRTIAELAVLSGGKQLERALIFDDGTIPVFGGAGVMGFTAGHNADGFVISVGRVGAYCGQFFAHRGKAWINNNASLIRQKKEDFGEWLFLSLRHADIDVIKKGAAQPFVSNGDLSKLPLVWPSEKVVESFLQFTVPLLKGQEDANRESKFLALLRDTLLPKLISGELRI